MKQELDRMLAREEKMGDKVGNEAARHREAEEKKEALESKRRELEASGGEQERRRHEEGVSYERPDVHSKGP